MKDKGMLDIFIETIKPYIEELEKEENIIILIDEESCSNALTAYDKNNRRYMCRAVLTQYVSWENLESTLKNQIEKLRNNPTGNKS